MRNCLYCGHTIGDDALTTCPKCGAVDPAVQRAVASAEPNKTPSPVAPGSTIAVEGASGTGVAHERARCLAWVETNAESFGAGVAIAAQYVVDGIHSGAWPHDDRDHEHDAAESDADGASLGGPGY
jgi:hypothetical protein